MRNSSKGEKPWWSRKEASNSSPLAKRIGTADYFKGVLVDVSESVIKERVKGIY